MDVFYVPSETKNESRVYNIFIIRGRKRAAPIDRRRRRRRCHRCSPSRLFVKIRKRVTVDKVVHSTRGHFTYGRRSKTSGRYIDGRGCESVFIVCR